MAAEHKDGRRLRKRYGKNRDPLFSVLDHPEVTPDNGGSIRTLHPSATYRKGTGGFRSTRSAVVYVALRSVVDTAGSQGAHAYEAIRNTLTPCLASANQGAKRLRYRFPQFPIDSRRAFDIAIASIALVATSPILLFACVAMALTMHRKVFFLQQRYGHGGRRFTLIKLRSLKDLTNEDVNGCRQQRLTPVARIIRRFGIDELPQFINILNGDMSIFGPRPFDIEPKIDGWKLRYAIKPGLIGLASVREKISGIESPLEKVVTDDLEYVRRRTWKMDAWLLIMAVACILTGRIDPQEQRVSNNRVHNTLNRLALSTID